MPKIKNVSFSQLRERETFFVSISIVLLILFRLWLMTGVPMMLKYMPHDDLYFAKAAHSIIHGEWLGTYSQMTIIKGPFYAFFMIFSYLTGLPLLLNETIFYVCACLVMYCALAPIIKSKWWRFLLFAVLLFCPATLANEWVLRVYREFVYFSLTLFVVAFALGILLRLDGSLKNLALWCVGLGLSMGAFLITREEGAWIYPMLFLLLLTSIVLIWKKKPDQKWQRSAIILFSILLWYIPTLCVSYMNYTHYGFWGVTEQLDKDFTRSLNTLYRIKTDTWYPYQPVSDESLEIAYQASPLFAELKDTIEEQKESWKGHAGRALEKKPDWYLEKYYLDKGFEMGSGHFPWLFRDALAANGYYASGSFPREYLHNLADELESACDNKTIDCYSTLGIPLVGTIQKEQVGLSLHFFADDLSRLLKMESQETQIVDIDVNGWNTFTEEYKYFEEFVYNSIDSHLFGDSQEGTRTINGYQDLREKAIQIKIKLMGEITLLYKFFTLPVTLLLVIIGLSKWIYSIVKKNRACGFLEASTFIFVAGLLISRVMLLAILDATTDVSGYYYSSSNYVFIYLLLFFILHFVCSKNLKKGKQQAN